MIDDDEEVPVEEPAALEAAAEEEVPAAPKAIPPPRSSAMHGLRDFEDSVTAQFKNCLYSNRHRTCNNIITETETYLTPQ